MEKILSLHEEIELFMKMKLSICKCNPCICSERRKELYFKELKDILSKYKKDYITQMLIHKRLVAVGYGSEKPVAPNFKPDGSDNPEGREQNRRTEFRVIGTLSSTEEVDTDENLE